VPSCEESSIITLSFASLLLTSSKMSSAQLVLKRRPFASVAV
jgi:hypothetical protein